MYQLSADKYGISAVEAVCHDAIMQAEASHAVAIVALSHGNETARWLSKYHASQPIFVLTDNKKIVNQLDGYYRACRGIEVEAPLEGAAIVDAVRAAGYELENGKLIGVDDWEKEVVFSEVSIWSVC